MPSNYEYVDWQPDDEATSTKFKQMSDNDQWIHDNIVTGDLIYRAGADGSLPAGRPVGSQTVKDMYAIFLPFNSGAPASFVDVTIEYPPVFTTPPVIIVTIGDGNAKQMCGIVRSAASTTRAIYRVFRRDGAAVVLSGNLNILLVGT